MNIDAKILDNKIFSILLNTSKENPTIHEKDNAPWSSGIYPRDAGSFQNLKSINVIHHIKQLKNKKYIISDAEKAFDNIPHPFMIKTLQNVGTEGTYLYVKVKVAQSCPTVCHPMYYTVHGILQARTLEWVAFPFSRGSS